MSLPVPTKRRRVIVNTDAKNEADDQYAIVHALLTPMFDLRGIIPAHFGERKSDRSMEESAEEVDLVLDLMGLKGEVTVANGAARAIPDEQTPADSPGARLIIEEAMREDAGPLFVAFLGPLTDMASAILLEPEIAQRDVTVVWIGGAPYGGKLPRGGNIEFNLSNDVAAANVVVASGIEVWQVPQSTYRMISVGYAELEQKVRPHGRIGDYLVQQLLDFNAEKHPHPIESRPLGDTPAIGLMISPVSAEWREQEPVRFTERGGYEAASTGSRIRVAESIDARFMLEDFFAKLTAFAQG